MTTVHAVTAFFAAVLMAVPAAASSWAPAESSAAANTPVVDTYFSCEGTTREGTSTVVLTGRYTGWTTTKPAASAQSGSGCIHADEGLVGHPNPQTAYTFSAVGTYTGNLDTLTFRMHNLYAGEGRTSGTSTLKVRVLVDGKSLFGYGETALVANLDREHGVAARELSIKPASTGGTGAVAVYEATITGIDLLTADQNVTHEIVFEVTTVEPMNVWAWGNTEAPSGITFSPATAAAVTTPAVPRSQRQK